MLGVGGIKFGLSAVSDLQPLWSLQVIDDSVGNTLVAASTLTPDIREKLNGSGGGDKVSLLLI